MSSYSSAIGLAAAAVADEHDMIVILPEPAPMRSSSNGYKAVYQIYTPSSRYLTPALEVLANRSPQGPGRTGLRERPVRSQRNRSALRVCS